MTKQFVDYEGLSAFNDGLRANYVAKEAGKGLSSNDYTTAEKQKVAQAITEEDLISRGYQAGGDVSAIATQILNEARAEMMAQITGAYKFKGTVATYADLPSENLTAGDVYNIAGEVAGYGSGANFAWTGSGWDALPGNIDFTTLTMTTNDILAITDPSENGNTEEEDESE